MPCTPDIAIARPCSPAPRGRAPFRGRQLDPSGDLRGPIRGTFGGSVGRVSSSAAPHALDARRATLVPTKPLDPYPPRKDTWSCSFGGARRMIQIKDLFNFFCPIKIVHFHDLCQGVHVLNACDSHSSSSAEHHQSG